MKKKSEVNSDFFFVYYLKASSREIAQFENSEISAVEAGDFVAEGGKSPTDLAIATLRKFDYVFILVMND